MLNLAVKKKPPQGRSPKQSARRAHFTSSLPVYSSRKSVENQDKDSDDDDDRSVSTSLPPTPTTLPVTTPSSMPSSPGRSSTVPISAMMKRKSMSIDSSMKKKSLCLNRSSSWGQSLDLSGILRSGMSHGGITDTLNTNAYEKDDISIQTPQQTKNLLTRFAKIDDVLQPAYDRIIRASSQTYPFVIGLKTIDQLPLPSAGEKTSISWGGKGVEYRVNVSLFDLTYKQFFGKTWASPPVQSKAIGQKTRLNYNQNVYFHSSLTEPSIIAVVEIIAVSQTDDGKKQHVSCGWGVLPIFKTEDDMPDTSHGKPPHSRRVEIYHGSPRSLLYLDEPIEGNPNLTIINGCQLLFTMATHKNLHKAMHLIPENALCGNNDIIPGVDEQKSRVHGKNVLDKPRALRSLPCYIEKISVNLNPTIEKFEEELCKQLNEDRINREDRVADGSTISIQERRLQIAVHNGLTYVHEPEVVHLSAESGEKVKKGSLRRNNHSPAAAARGHQRTNSTSSLGSSVTALVHKNRVELEGMLEDPLFAVVFVMEYLLGEPMAERDRRASMAKSSTFRAAIRWAAWSPINNLRDAEHTINLLGGPSTIPDKSFVYRQTFDGAGSSASLAGIGNGIITFSFSRVDRKDKENIPPTVPLLSLPQESARPGSPGSEGSGALTEIQVTGRPPVPSSQREGGGFKDKAVRHHRAEEVDKSTFSKPSLREIYTPGTAFSQYGGYLTPHGQAGIPIGMPTSLNQSFARESNMGFIMSSYNQQSARHHIPVEVQHIRDGQMPVQSARGPAAALDLQELPFTPVHAPIMASAPGMHKSQTLSRSAYAKLYTAGFPQIVDRRGEPPDVVDPVDKMNFIMAKEGADRLQANEVILQFLAYSRMLSFDSGSGSVKQPATVFFTFQFYRFPQVTTERLLLGNVEGELSADPKSLPCLLQKLEKDGPAMKGPPGYQVKYHIDPAYLKPGEGRLFVEHMANQTLHIDVWDGDSLLLIGSCAVELKNLCRQGREAVQVTHELDIVSTEYVEGESVIPSGDLSRDGGMRPVEVNTILKGRLHLRVANVGHPADPSLSRTDRMALQLRPKNMVSMDGEAGSAFGGGSLHAVSSHQSAIRKACKAMHMVEANHELATALFSKKHKEKLNEEERASAESEHRKRKLARMEAVRQAEGSEPQLPIRTFRQEKEERASDLKTIEMYRNIYKKEGILNMLNQAITVEHTVHPSMGTAEFFEFKLRNPYNTEHTIIVEVSDPELRIITDTREWRYYKMLNNMTTPVEEGMFNLETKSERPEIFLRPKEAVNVPFVYVSFRADHTVQPQAPTDPSRPVSKKTVPGNKKDDAMESRLVKVIFKTQNHKPVSVLAVKVEPQPHIVDQTFRFHHPEQSFLKKSIRLPPLHTLPGVPVGGPVLNQIIVRCSDPNVICESRKVQQGEPHDVFLKVACGSSATTKRFFVAVYQDQYLAKPIQIWQFYVHALQRVDVACIEGQTSRFTLILRGTQSSRLVQAFSSHAAEMEIEPKEPFMLAANALQELHVGVRPLTPGGKFLYLNVVDIEYHQLVRTWLVCVSCRTPIISKAYELMLPVGGGKGSNKRIAYTNPYPIAKTFQLRTNRDDLLQFKDTHLEIGAGETQNIGLRFAPTQAPGTVEILVFINDEDDKNEETFCVRASYS